MNPTSPGSGADRVLYEFDDFRVDPIRRRIFRAGEAVPLTPKAFTILLLLLERRGEIVDKEDLLKQVWPDTFVTEANLTQNVSALRKALGEKANDRRYVVTVPGRGYSFAGDVREVQRMATAEIQLPVILPEPEPAAEPPVPVVPPTRAEAPAAPPAEPLRQRVEAGGSAVPATEPPAPSGRRRKPWLLAVVALLGVAAVAWLLTAPPWRPSRTSGVARGRAPGGGLPAVAVLGFRNLSGRAADAWVATALGEMVTTELAASPSARMIPSESVARARRSLPFAYREDLAAEQLVRLHELLGADLIVLGSYLITEAEGGKVRLDIRALRAPGGEVAASFALTGKAESLIDLGAEAGAKLRSRLAWAEPSPEEARAVAALQPANNRSAQLYSLGLDRLRASDAAGARDYLAEAAEADPSSAVVRLLLSQAYAELGSDREAQREAEAALKLSAALPREQRLEIEARSSETRRDWDKASEIYRSLWLLDPSRVDYGLRLVQSLSTGGRGSEAAAAIEDLRRLDSPHRDDPRIDLAEAQHARRVGNPTLEMKAARTAEAKGRNLNQQQVVGEALLMKGDAYYTQGLPERSIEELERAREIFQRTGNRAALARTLNRLGATDLDTGRLREAEEHFLKAKELAEQLGSESLVASQIGVLGVAAFSQGDLLRARRLTEDSYRRFGVIGDRFYETRILFFLADVENSMGETAAAQEKLERVLDQARDSGNQVEVAQALDRLGDLLVDGGRFAEGRKLQEEAYAAAKRYGDPLLAASYLTSLGRTLAYQGDFAAAQARLGQALAEKRRVKDRVGELEVVGQLAALAARRGALPAAREQATRQLELARQVGARLEEVDALRHLGRLDLAAGDLPLARRRMVEGLAKATELAAGREVADLKIALAQLSLEEGRPEEALRLARESADWSKARSIVVAEGRALLVVADAALALKRRAEAAEAVRRAFSLSASPTDTDRELRLASLLRDAQAAAAEGSLGEAAGHLGGVLKAAEEQGELPLLLEGRFVQGALQARQGEKATAAATFQALARDAGKAGFLLLARRAEKQAAALLSRPLG